MKLTGSHKLDAPRGEVWKALLDPDVIAATLPGCDALEEVGENEYV
ncbi:MAG: CoxG family protein, partial [Gemmatimonadota bacterium]